MGRSREKEQEERQRQPEELTRVSPSKHRCQVARHSLTTMKTEGLHEIKVNGIKGVMKNTKSE